MAIELQEIINQLQSLTKNENLSPARISAFTDIMTTQCALKKEVRRHRIQYANKQEGIERLKKTQQPIIAPGTLALNSQTTQKAFDALHEAFRRHDHSESTPTNNILTAQQHGTFEPSALITNFIQHDDDFFTSLTDILKLDKELLLSFSLALSQVFLEEIAEPFQNSITSDIWNHPWCPVCGGSARIAQLDKEAGNRLLHCQNCAHTWRFARLACAHCATDEQGNLKILGAPNSPYRIDCCDHCGRYIKTYDTRSAEERSTPFIAAIEDFATMYLDIIAAKEGYKRIYFPPPSTIQSDPQDNTGTVH